MSKTARRKRRIDILKAKRALCKRSPSAASATYTFLSLPPSSIYYKGKVGIGITSSTVQKTTIPTSTPATNTPCRPVLISPRVKQQLNPKGLFKDEVRRQRNRLSAENSRQKKLAIENELRAKIAILEKENGSLRQRVQQLEYSGGDDSVDKIKKNPFGFDENVCNNIMIDMCHSSGFTPAA